MLASGRTSVTVALRICREDRGQLETLQDVSPCSPLLVPELASCEERRRGRLRPPLELQGNEEVH